MLDVIATRFHTIHGHRRAYVLAGPEIGTAPVLLLLHGLGCDHHTWDPVIEELAKRYTVLAPDLLGHGESAKPRGDYSVGGYANGMRDLLTVLGIDKATVVGHSFGGGVAMQFAYQYPERTERLMLVDSGGLGREVTPFIRVLGLPFAMAALAFLTLPGVRQANKAALRTLQRIPTAATRDLGEVAQIVEALKDPRMRYALHRLVESAIDVRGQVVSMRDRAYLTAAMPMCVLWGEDDLVLPVSHARVIEELAPEAWVVVQPDSGHFPHRDHPQVFIDLVDEFMALPPATYSRARWRRLLKTRTAPALEPVADAVAPVADETA